MSYAETIKRKFSTQVLDRLSNKSLNRIIKNVGDMEIDLIRQRTNAGRDKNGRAFRSYSPRYVKRKKQLIRSGIGASSIWGARRYSQFMRLSGRMFTDMKIKNIKVQRGRTNVTFKYDIGFKTTRSARIAEYHNVSGAGKSRVRRQWLGRIKDKRGTDRLAQKWRSEIRRELS